MLIEIVRAPPASLAALVAHVRAVAGGPVMSLTGCVAWIYFGETWTFRGGLPLGHAHRGGTLIGASCQTLLGGPSRVTGHH